MSFSKFIFLNKFLDEQQNKKIVSVNNRVGKKLQMAKIRFH